MILTKDHLTEYTNFLYSDLAEQEKIVRQNTFIEKFNRFDQKHWIFYSQNVEINQLLTLHFCHNFTNNYILFMSVKRGFDSDSQFVSTFKSLFLEASLFFKNRLDHFIIEFRCEESDLLQRTLDQSNFKLDHSRLEFQKDLSEDLVIDSSKIEFKSYMDWGLSLEEVAELMTESAQGDPDFSDDDDALDCLKSYLSSLDLYSKDDCIQVGKIDSQLACILVPQSENLWGTLSYMGLKPKFRNQGLGQIIHLYGLTCLYKQGARDYNGGTLDNNFAMQKVFQKNDCKLRRKLQVWFYN
ncbi:hypothetical protein MJH12_02850 [bacterium]|nr:hypothetical protein [bacterium]